MSNDVNDVWESAENAQLLPSIYFGQVHISPWFCVLEKGVGRVPYDPQVHRADQKRTALDIEIQPLPSSGLEFAIVRNLIAEDRDWAGTILPSIKALGIAPKDLHQKWARVDLVETGKKYTNRNGEEKKLTTLKFLEVYQTEAECEAAAAKLFGKTATDTPAPAAAPASSGNGNAEKETAKMFLPALWKQAGQDVTKFMELINNNPLTSKYFTVNSPEVLNLVTQQG